MNKMAVKDFKPTPDMKAVAKAVFVCMAAVETIKPIVEGYQKKVLAFWQFPIAPEWSEKGMKEPKVVLDPKDTYLMSNEDFKLYHADIQDEQKKAGLKTEHPDFCPLLVAQNELRKAEHLLIKVMKPVTTLTLDQLLCAGLDSYYKYIDLTLRLLAPYVKEGGDTNDTR